MKLLACWIVAGTMVFVADEAEQTKKDLQKMQGDWAGVEMIRDGNRLAPDDAGAYFRTVEGEAYSIARYRKVAGKGTFKIDAEKSPKQIDATPATPGANVLKGIYEWDGERLKIIFGPPGGDRPTDFKAAPGSQRSYTFWEKEKK